MYRAECKYALYTGSNLKRSDFFVEQREVVTFMFTWNFSGSGIFVFPSFRRRRAATYVLAVHRSSVAGAP